MPFCPLVRASLFAEPINDAMVAFAIDQTQARQCAFLAQIAKESGELRYEREIASGAQYEGRHDLGNSQAGDGVKFAGRGLIQVTGRKNYTDCSLALYSDYRLLDTPELLEQPHDAAQSAGWFWQTHNLNNLADAGEFERITFIINGGYNGHAERLEYWRKAKSALGMN